MTLLLQGIKRLIVCGMIGIDRDDPPWEEVATTLFLCLVKLSATVAEAPYSGWEERVIGGFLPRLSGS